MNYAFSPEGLRQLEAIRHERTLFAFDFDGTLAPIVRNAFSAKIPPRTWTLLESLADTAPVAAVSGRPLRELMPLVPPSFRAWAGEHGADIFPRKFSLNTGHPSGRRVVRRWQRELTLSLRNLPGVWLEEKALSLTVHFRESPHPAASRRAILAAVAALEPSPRALPGKRVVNLLNPLLPHKGNAVINLMRGLDVRHTLYVGDDSNDEDVFALGDPRIRTVRVGRLAGSRAALYLKRQTEIDRLLRYILDLRAPRNLPAPRRTGYPRRS